MRIRRRHLEMHQRAAAEKIGSNAATWCQYETGKRPMPERRLRAVADALGVSPDWLRDGVGDGSAAAPPPAVELSDHATPWGHRGPWQYGELLRQLREGAGVSREDLAREIGVEPRHIANAETTSGVVLGRGAEIALGRYLARLGAEREEAIIRRAAAAACKIARNEPAWNGILAMAELSGREPEAVLADNVRAMLAREPKGEAT